MTNFAQSVLLVLMGAGATGVVGAAGFFLKRRLTRAAPDAVDKFIEHDQKLLAVEADSTVPRSKEDQERLGSVIRELHPGLTYQNTMNVQEPALCEAEIRMRAAQEADAAMLAVRQKVEQLEYRLNAEQQAVLAEAQSAWERHADLQARLAALAFEGGTIMPTIYHTERLVLAQERAVAVQRVLDSFML